MDGARRRRRTAGVAIGALAASNVVVNRALPAPAYVPWNLGLAAALLGLSRRADVGWGDVGLAPADASRGLRLGLGAVGAVAAGCAIALTASDHQALRDHRVVDLPPRQAWFQAVVRIPLGTVVLEEVAFRGVLPALLRPARLPAWTSDLVAAGLFGLWHVLPARDMVAANEGARALEARIGPARTRALAVACTAAAGLALASLRRAGGHLAAPAMAHWATNTLGLVAARVAACRS